MNPAIDAVLLSWPFDPGLIIGLVLTAGVYLRGWFKLSRVDKPRWHAGQLAAFLGGLIAIFLALDSPIETFSEFYLQVHMVQHLLLMMVAPPLLWLGDPLFPLLKGLPAPIRGFWIAPLFRWQALRHLCRRLTHPFCAGLLYVLVASMWHLPALYEMALGSVNWHYTQHVSFLVIGVLFWFPVVRPYPFKASWSLWLLVPLLFFADVQNTILSALLTFSDGVIYSHYAQMPHLDGSSALDDQATAGGVMWVFGSLAYLVPLFAIVVRLLLGDEAEARRQKSEDRNRNPGTGRQQAEVGNWRPGDTISLPVLAATLTSNNRPLKTGFDLLRVPLLGDFFRWRHSRLCLQLPLLLLTGIMIYDGLTGPDAAPMNLAGVLPWIHWRGLLIIGLLIVGNVFCMACPFMLPRLLARRLFPQRYTWPRGLRNKWLALLLLSGFLWAYDAFSLWDSPWLTAWITIGYFAGALVIDSFFRGAVFCKYVCPIGQFNFVQSLLSPWVIKARDPAVCANCRTKDCIRGNAETRGCELNLFVPQKSSNMDCTLCLDCVHACPHDNVGMIAAPPGAALCDNRQRSGIGRLGRRLDIAALVLVLVFGAFANAGGMVGPIVEWQERFTLLACPRSPVLATASYYVFCLVVLPVPLVGSAAVISRRWGRMKTGTREVATRFAFSLVPLGFGMWCAHYCFHFLTGYATVLPLAQRFAADLGLNSLGTPEWVAACCRPVASWLLPLEILFLDVGLLLSLYIGYRLALTQSMRPSPALKALAPWAIVMVLLFAVGIWILFQPMQMRGVL